MAIRYADIKPKASKPSAKPIPTGINPKSEKERKMAKATKAKAAVEAKVKAKSPKAPGKPVDGKKASEAKVARPKAEKPPREPVGAGKVPSEALANMIGSTKAVVMTQAVKATWDYIKAHNLQNPANKREILCDDTMRAVFDTDVLGMFDIGKGLVKHLS